MPKEPDRARVRHSWPRRQWLKFVALIEDHPRVAISSAILFFAFVLFYGIRLRGFAHFGESGARWRLQTFGGKHQVDRSVRVPDVILSFQKFQCDRLDLTMPTAAHLGGTAFREELREIAAQDGGVIRVIAFDPRISVHPRFETLANAFGMKTWEFGARCWHSTAVLIHLSQELGDQFQVRLVTEPSADAKAPFFFIGRSGHAYLADKPNKRLDTIVSRPDEPTGFDSFNDPGMIFKNRPGHPQVKRFVKAFESHWESAMPLGEVLQTKLLEQLRRTDTAGD